MDGLEADLNGRVAVLRIDLLSDLGRTTAAWYGVRAVPTTLLFDGAGNIVLSQGGIPNTGVIREAAEELLTSQ